MILMGLRGAGKTVVGRAVAAQLGGGWEFLDLDDLTRAALGCATTAEAWARAGEPNFRAAEARALATLLTSAPARPRLILALGGGTPTAPGAAETLRTAAADRTNSALLIYLRAQPETLRARLRGHTADRPSLTGADPLAEIEEVFTRRDPLYRHLATLTLDTDPLTPDQTAAAIAARASPPA